jgi:hypothetical protein
MNDGNVGGGNKAINKNNENIIALAPPDPPIKQPTDAMMGKR